MRSTLSHRGPDGEGEYLDGEVALGHTRLSVIDVDSGAQPLANEDGTVWVILNGEIYNFRSLRQELVQKGHHFTTASDTEVVVHAYEEYGTAFVRKLNGMFALAVFDSVRRRLVLARDPLGIKPLFYSITQDGLFFASEIKAVLAGSRCAPVPRRESIVEYLTFRYVAGSHSFFEGIRRFPPGHVATWGDGELHTEEFWSLPAYEGRHTAPPLDAAADELEAHLLRSVELQMVSDVPLGTFCSGGLDSGLITGYASRFSPHRLSTFSVGFDDPVWDESPLARDSASRFGTNHRSIVARPEGFHPLLHSLIWHNDEPLSHPNSVLLFQLSRVAREDVTVVLTGEGADELFGGYPRYHVARLRGLAERFPAWAQRGVAATIGTVPGHRAARVGAALRHPLADSLLFNSAFADPELVGRLTGISVSDVIEERRALLERSLVPGDLGATLTRYEMSTYLGCSLDRMDRMSMAAGLEGRVPFLDLPLVEWASHLPTSLKMSRGQSKRVVKRLGERILSGAVTHGPKSGFGVPLGDWFRTPAFVNLLSRLDDQEHVASDYFDSHVLRRIISEHLRGIVDHREVLWQILNVYLWSEVHIDSTVISLRVANP
jgi:asparagine synthase (glutamine-hydrolysing)